jgi:L-arabinose isomerase
MPRTDLRPRVGLLPTMIDMYRVMPDFQRKVEEMALELCSSLSEFADVTYSGPCDDRRGVEAAVAAMEAADADLLLVLPLTYTLSHIVLPAVLRTTIPALILNTQPRRTFTPDLDDMTFEENQALPCVYDLANAFSRNGAPFRAVTGYYRDPAFLQEIKDWTDAADVARAVRQMRVGLVGHPMDGMGDFALDTTLLLGQVGVEVQHVPPGEVAALAAGAPPEEIARQIAADRAAFQVQEPLPEEEHRAASRLEWALRRTVQDHDLDGIAVHFMTVDDDGRFEAWPLMAASKLMGEGYGYGGEGDVACAAAMAMMIRLCGAAHFFEGWAMDFEREAVLFMHMGEGNYRLAHPDRPVRLVRSPFPMKVSYPPVNLVFDLRPGEATVVNLTTAHGGRLKLTVTEGRVLDVPSVHAVPMPQGAFKPDLSLQEFLRRSFEAGASHHSALVYGRHAGKVLKLANLLGVVCERI